MKNFNAQSSELGDFRSPDIDSMTCFRVRGKMTHDDHMAKSIWEKGRKLPDRDPTQWRQDQCGAWLRREQYNNAGSEYGWKIVNVTAGGGDEPQNLQPFHWNNSFDVANGKPQCRVTADRTGLTPGQTADQFRNTTV